MPKKANIRDEPLYFTVVITGAALFNDKCEKSTCLRAVETGARNSAFVPVAVDPRSGASPNKYNRSKPFCRDHSNTPGKINVPIKSGSSGLESDIANSGPNAGMH